MKKKLLSAFVAAMLLMQSISALALTSHSAIVIDSVTGQSYYEVNADEPLAPASMTKVMTVYLIYEKMAEGRLSKDTLIVADEEDYRASIDPEATNVTLHAGTAYSVDSLIDAILVPSACAASAMVGKYISGSEAEFARLMTNTAQSLGLNAYYEDASGLSDNNRITARSMAKLSQLLISKYPDVLNYTQKPYIIFEGTRYNSTNRMLPGGTREYAWTDGLKTGTTTLAGACFTGTSVRDGIRLISVTMHSDYGNSRFDDTKELMDIGFDAADRTRNYMYATDIRLFIDGNEAPVFFYNGPEGGLYMFIRDLKDYGFSIYWDAETQAAVAEYKTENTPTPIPMDMYRGYTVGEPLYRILPDTGIKAGLRFNGSDSVFKNIHAIDGYTMISADQLASFAASYEWNDADRTLNIHFR